MSLYDDLDEGNPTGSQDISGWSSSMKLLQSTLQTKKASASSSTSTPSAKKRGLAPVIDLKRGGEEIHFDHRTGKMKSGISQFIAPEPSVFAGVKDEYNPMFPNDYDEIIKKRRRERRDRGKERERERDREREERRRRRDDEDEEKPRRRPRGDEDRDEDERRAGLGGGAGLGSAIGASSGGGELRPRMMEEDEDDYHFDRSKRGAAIAPPPSLLEDSKSNSPPPPDLPRGDSGRVQDPFGLGDDDSSPRVLPGTSFGLGGSVASKIMAKYGYKEGQGLGKKEQGMSQALVVEKTSRRGGKILHEKDIQRDSPTPMVPTKPNNLSNADLLKNPSKVVLLRNMVGPGEVDSELESETAEECAKYGKVLKCVIFEIPEVPDEEAVRIFVEFERMEAAIKAVVDLNGRFFGGKVVKACFYGFDKFKNLDLADDLL